jgi:hypothetical protein
MDITEQDEETYVVRAESFRICPLNWRDTYSTKWRLRYTKADLKRIAYSIAVGLLKLQKTGQKM